MAQNTLSPIPSTQSQGSRKEALAEASAEQHLADLQALNLRLLTLQGDLDRHVAQLRLEGVTWARIANVLHISPQAAHQRWSPEGVEKHRIRQRRLHGLDSTLSQ